MEQRQQHLLDELIFHELYIDAPIDTVYYYVTQPDRWHEWHPASLRADTGLAGSLPAGHRFSKTIDLLGLQIHMSCRVLVAVFPKEFKIVFSSAPADGSIHYQLCKYGDGTPVQAHPALLLRPQPAQPAPAYRALVPTGHGQPQAQPGKDRPLIRQRVARRWLTNL
ncbi:Polyketide cyclase / dehydrase and lipid transport [Pseudomonas sp. LAMO17WK12:I10]|nr:polyketide cyclase/dehydrase/lipid transport protein [Pseudomonas sp. LAMO17WK12:I9]SNY28490.1 Polyketide cyclase / dehydrase and lipid transport [Pseudomonas sp. LAMO17WK12:I10]